MTQKKILKVFGVRAFLYSLLGFIPGGYLYVRYYLPFLSLIKYSITELLLLFLLWFNFTNQETSFISVFCSFYLFYELGYLDNDFFSSRMSEKLKKRKGIHTIKFDPYLFLIFRLFLIFIIICWIGINFNLILPFLIIIVFLFFNRLNSIFLRIKFLLVLTISKFLYFTNIFIMWPINFLELRAIAFLILPFTARKLCYYYYEKVHNRTNISHRFFVSEIIFWILISISGFVCYGDERFFLGVLILILWSMADCIKQVIRS